MAHILISPVLQCLDTIGKKNSSITDIMSSYELVSPQLNDKEGNVIENNRKEKKWKEKVMKKMKKKKKSSDWK